MKISKGKKGFTLVEVVVSLAIFAVVSLIAVGALLKIIDANKKAQSLKTSVNNIHALLDTMSRDLRTGTNYYCVPGGSFILNSSAYVVSSGSYTLPYASQVPCSTGTAPWTIVFFSSKTSTKSGGTCQLIHAYRFETQTVNGITIGTIKKAEQPSFTGQNTCMWQIDSNAALTSWNPRPFVPLVSPDVNITEAHVSVETGNNATIGQPRVFIHIKGYSGTKEKNQTPFDVQTTISQRIND